MTITFNSRFHYLIERALRKEMRTRWQVLIDLCDTDNGDDYFSYAIDATNIEIDALADCLLQYHKQTEWWK